MVRHTTNQTILSKSGWTEQSHGYKCYPKGNTLVPKLVPAQSHDFLEPKTKNPREGVAV